MGRKWTPEQRAKFTASMARVREEKKKNGGKGVYVRRKGAAANGQVHDAIVYLRHAQRSCTRRLRDGALKEYDESHLLATLALRALEGQGSSKGGS